VELCARLARFKKENKELLTFLLFDAHDEDAFVASVKADLDAMFNEMRSVSNLYLVKKSLRKILRHANKFARFSGSKNVEVQLLLYFLSKWLDSGAAFRKNPVLVNLYKMQLKKIEKAMTALHEDLQFDYRRELLRLGDAL